MPSHEPVPSSEQGVLEALIMIRNQLTVLKRVGSTYQPKEILNLYLQLNANVTELFELREEEGREKSAYRNRLDDVIDDVYQLLSLFWMVLGKNLESPATYVQLISIQQCLDHLQVFGIYTLADIEPFDQRIRELGAIIEEGKKNKYNTVGDEQSCLHFLVRKKLSHCRLVLKELMDNWNAMSDSLSPIQTRLVEIRRDLAIQIAKGEVDSEKVTAIQKELRNFDSLRVDGKFLLPDGSKPEGQAQVCGLLEECFEDVHALLSKETKVSEELKPIYDRLITMRDQLSKLYITRRWTMREIDLWTFQVQLNEVDVLRKQGKFYDPEGKPYEGQTILHFLLQKCYRIIYKLLSSSEPIAEALMPVHNQLSTLRKCLTEVKTWGGPFTTRELYPYQIKLASIDNLRVDGKFLDEHGQVPEGQAVVMALLNECYDIMFELKEMVED
ncbi:hypothetical protein DSO57_1034004 [Entomophthora muscae]|uniref:Uncharacterized protein n=2 Tax=Entomophthora muscae TaxID=34485 RepID=A0ACC2UKA4_9FUNG|nr:hypothetical protein DSO57_1034004 [Entomophthora muscae]